MFLELLWILTLTYILYRACMSGDDVAVLEIRSLNLFLWVFLLHNIFFAPPHTHTFTQMVFYIEACESGSMMNHLPADIDGELNFTSSEKVSTSIR